MCMSSEFAFSTDQTAILAEADQLIPQSPHKMRLINMAEANYAIPTYPGVYPVNHGGDGHRGHDGLRGADAAFLGNLHDASRDIAASNTSHLANLGVSNASAGRDVDLMSAVREEGGDGRDATRDAASQVTHEVSNGVQHLEQDLSNGFQHLGSDIGNSVQHLGHEVSQGFLHMAHENADAFRDLTGNQHNAHRDIIREGSATRADVNIRAKENVEHILDQGSRGRETTLQAKADLMREHCETQRLVIEKACEVKEVVHAEANLTRELIRDEGRAILQRELDEARSQNGLLQLQINLLSSGNGPLLKA